MANFLLQIYKNFNGFCSGSFEFRIATKWSAYVYFCLFFTTIGGYVISSKFDCETDKGVSQSLIQETCTQNLFS